jgi:hypothetical protein
MKWQKGPPLKNFVKKHHLRVAAPLPRQHVARAATTVAGRWPASSRRRKALAQVGPAAISIAGKVRWHHAASPIAGTLLRLHRQPQK